MKPVYGFKSASEALAYADKNLNGRSGIKAEVEETSTGNFKIVIEQQEVMADGQV